MMFLVDTGLGGERLEKAQVRFLPDDVTVEADVGQLLLDVALEAGIFLPAACGGAGACGKCRVKVVRWIRRGPKARKAASRGEG